MSIKSAAIQLVRGAVLIGQNKIVARLADAAGNGGLVARRRSRGGRA